MAPGTNLGAATPVAIGGTEAPSPPLPKDPTAPRGKEGQAAPETDKVLLSRAHEARGRILAFLERNDEAMKEFDAAIEIGEVAGGAYQDAIAGKKKLAQP